MVTNIGIAMLLDFLFSFSPSAVLLGNAFFIFFLRDLCLPWHIGINIYCRTEAECWRSRTSDYDLGYEPFTVESIE